MPPDPESPNYNELVQPLARAISFGLLVCAAIVPAGSALAQMDMSAHAMGTENQIPPADLPVPLKMTGIGNIHMQISAKPEAQLWFDQGLNLIHDYWDYESARAFQQAIRVDPQCAICYWGLYRAESFYHGLAQGYAIPALQNAVKLKGHAARRERLFIEATEIQAGLRTDLKPTDARAADLQLRRKLAKDNPKDVEAQLFLAERVDQKEELAILEAILKDDPGNSAANHMYIHALEAGPHPEKALRAAEALATAAPASGHMVHMPGHIYSRMGDYPKAEQAFAASTLVDERYMQEQHVTPDNDWNYVHNLMYAIANLMEEGKLNKATELSLKLTGARGERESTLYTYSTRDSISRLDPRLPVALRTGDWKQVPRLLPAAETLTRFPNLEFLARQLATFAEGMAALQEHNVTAAEGAALRFDAGLWRMSQQAKTSGPMAAMPAAKAPDGTPTLQLMSDAQLQPLMSTLTIMSQELQASLLAAQGKPADAHSLFLKAAQAEKALGYREPPSYIRPVGETEAAAMQSLGSWVDARAAFEQALLERPRSGFALYGIAFTSEKSGNADAARKEYTEFLAAWKDADPALDQVIHARSYLAFGHVP